MVLIPSDFDLSNVAFNDGLVTTDGLNEEELESFFDDDRLVQRPPTLLRRVRRVEDRHLAVLVLQVVQHVLQSFLANLSIGNKILWVWNL